MAEEISIHRNSILIQTRKKISKDTPKSHRPIFLTVKLNLKKQLHLASEILFKIFAKKAEQQTFW